MYEKQLHCKNTINLGLTQYHDLVKFPSPQKR